MGPRVRVIGVLLLTALAAPLARAQRITGVVRDTTSSASLPGAVVSVLDAQRQALARAITDATGRYSLELSAGATQLRVVRIGFQPRVLALFASRGTSQTLDVMMTKVPTLLSTVVVSDERMCSSDRDRPAALSLWEQARSGLLASIVARESKPANATIISYERWIDLTRGRVLRQTARKQSGLTTRPFVTRLLPRALAQRGYLEQNGGVFTFNAPDADVLLDESFAETHCFSVRNEDATHAGAIGIAFEPTRGRDRIVDVRGTLWLEATVPALRSIEFSFVGGDAATVLGDAAGVLHFRSMANGVVFVDEWHARVPVMIQSRDAGRRVRVGSTIATTADIVDTRPGTQASETGGIVRTAVWPDGERFESSLKPLAGIVVERGTSTPMRGALVAIDATGDSVLTDAAGRWSIFPLFLGRHDVTAADTSYSAFVSPRIIKTVVDITAADQKEVRLELPSRTESVRNLCSTDQLSATTSTLLGHVVDIAGADRLPESLRVSGAWLGGAAVVNGRVNWRNDSAVIALDDKGRFSLCGVPREKALQLAIDRGGVRLTDTLATVGRNTEVEELTWRVNFSALKNVVADQRVRLQGHVTKQAGAVPLAGVDLSLPELDRRVTTDATGAFSFDSLPPGYRILSVRQVGFEARTDTLRLAAGRDMTRDYALALLAAPSDTVRAASDETKYFSSGLRGFEARRANRGSGYFIAESELRAHDSEQLANLISGRAPALRIVNGVSGGTYLASNIKQCKGRALSASNCSPCYITTYVDGVLRYDADRVDERTEPPDFSRISITELAGVEFYSRESSIPPPYTAARSGCGTLLLWSRER